MAATEETLELARGLRVVINATVDEATREIIKGWSRSWDTLAAEWEASMAELTAGDRWPSQTKITKSKRTLSALAQTEEELQKLASRGAIRANQDIENLVNEARSIESMMIASQYPNSAITAAGGISAMAKSFDRLDNRAFTAIVTRTTQNVTSLAEKIGPRAYSGVLNDLIRGTAIGENPRRAAARMTSRLESRFFAGAHDMNIIARTEMLDAARESGMEIRRHNEDVLKGWQWLCALDHRTCPSCWSHHGEIHPVTVPGPWDHQQGRCTAAPATRSWKDLGYDIEEPPSIIPDPQEAFSALPREQQLAIMGKGRLSLLDQGKVNWSDLSQFKSNANWRGSYVPTPLKDLVG